MLKEILTQHYIYINMFFIFSFLGWIMECIVIRREKGKVENRGFVTGPFCIVYGFGAMLGYFLLEPLSHSLIALFIGGAIGATLFEYLTAMVMLHLFGKFWWDYTEKPFNYKGIICLESTVAWGFVALVVIGSLYTRLLDLLLRMPSLAGEILSVVLLILLIIDFTYNLYRSRKAAKENNNNESIFGNN